MVTGGGLVAVGWGGGVAVLGWVCGVVWRWEWGLGAGIVLRGTKRGGLDRWHRRWVFGVACGWAPSDGLRCWAT